MKQINMEWMQSLLKEDQPKKEYKNDLPTIDWVQNGKAFKREVKFKLLPANSKENNIFAIISGQHFSLGANKDFHMVCPEQTSHLKALGVKCPICEAKRQLLAIGFTEDELKTEGKFGPVPVFDPTMRSSVKAVILGTDLKSWDQAHVSVLQQNGTYLTRWLVEKYMDSETPDLLQWEASNAIRFSRTTDNGKWEREITFSQFVPTSEVLEKLRGENEALSLPDIWKMPSDEDLLKARQIAEEMKQSYIQAKQAMLNSTSTITDSMPF